MLAKDAAISGVATTYVTTSPRQKLNDGVFALDAVVERPHVSEAGRSDYHDRRIFMYSHLGPRWPASICSAHNSASQGFPGGILV